LIDENREKKEKMQREVEQLLEEINILMENQDKNGQVINRNQQEILDLGEHNSEFIEKISNNQANLEILNKQVNAYELIQYRKMKNMRMMKLQRLNCRN
jgi:hypothetical protein